eukprot:gene6802-8459_t
MAPTTSNARYENVLLGVLFLTFGFVFFDRLALSFLFPFMAEELQLGNRHLGMLSSVLALAWAGLFRWRKRPATAGLGLALGALLGVTLLLG